MLASLTLLILSALQLAPAPSAATATPGGVNAPAAATSAATQASAAAALDPENLFRLNALRNLWSMNFQELGPDEWWFLGMYYGVRALFVLILMTLAWTLSSWSSSALRAALARVHFDETLSIFLAKLLRWAILLLVGLTCLSYFGVETTGFAAVIGAAGLAIGLAFQGTLSNFAAGAMLLIFRPYKVGDSVVLAGFAGTVYEIELFTTAVDMADNRRVIIPNSSIFGAVIENHSSNLLRRAEVLVGVAYSADIDETRAALNRAVAAVTLLASDRKSEVALLNLGASSVDWAVRGWAKRDALGDAKQALIRAVKMELDGSGIGIPFPQLDIHFDPQSVESDRRAAL
jgi:small conductance mechanosensitive channel